MSSELDHTFVSWIDKKICFITQHPEVSTLWAKVLVRLKSTKPLPLTTQTVQDFNTGLSVNQSSDRVMTLFKTNSAHLPPWSGHKRKWGKNLPLWLLTLGRWQSWALMHSQACTLPQRNWHTLMPVLEACGKMSTESGLSWLWSHFCNHPSNFSPYSFAENSHWE